MRSLTFKVLGVPTPKGSVTRMPNGAMLPGSSKGQRIKQNVWRADVRAAATEAMGDDPLMAGALRVMIDCTLPYPHSSLPKYKLGWWPALKQPDVDKLARGVLDHLTGIVWVDDAQVISLSINKAYAWDDKPSAHVIIDELSEVSLRMLGGSQTAIRQMLSQEWP